MLNVGFHATNGVKLGLGMTHTSIEGLSGTYSYVTATLRVEESTSDLTLFLSPENATQLAKALLSQVQQIEEKEIRENHA